MPQIFIYFTFIFISRLSLYLNSCLSGLDHCSICNPFTGLCYQCDKDNFIPNEKGGCDYKRRCIEERNYCLECSKDNICIKCEEGFFPDEYGSCSYSKNCILSERGKCLKCKENYFLVGIDNFYGEGVKICKSIFSEDLKFCQDINNRSGLCNKCKEGFYLNKNDRKCSTTKNCDESIFGVCSKCINGYYLDKKDNLCKIQKNNFIHCKETINGENCDICDENYFFDENGICIYNNYCLKENEENKCEKCINNYYLSENDFTCTLEHYCKYGDRITGICTYCKDNYYIDYKDGKCKPNNENNDYKYCKIANDSCIECISFDYYIGEDNKCSTSKFCSESNNGICFECIDNYYLGLDNKCTNIKHCIYSDYYNQCLECEDNYFYNKNENLCKSAEGNLTHCKISTEGIFCENCKDDFYLNQTDNLCYSNKNENNFYKCAMIDLYGNYCIKCIKDYYLGYKDHKCSKIEGCILSENENICLECDEDYCLDVKTGKCEYNDEIVDEGKKFYYRCNKTNKEGIGCEICINGFEVNEKGLCVNNYLCEEKRNGICQKCKSDVGNFCLNKDFECIKIYSENCLECNDIFDLNSCTKCLNGYEINMFGRCIENGEE